MRGSLAASKNPYTIQWFTQKLDHFNDQDSRTFQQRYVIDSEYAKDGSSPVLLYVCGEGNCASDELDPQGWPAMLAKKMGAHFIALEHRYYGESRPFDEYTAPNMPYLSIEQAIQDLVTFENWVVSTRKITGKWIAIGGSYPASLAAIYRLEYPKLVAGAIASSACSKFIQESTEPDQRAADDLGLACTAKYRNEILLPIQMAIGNPKAMEPIKSEFDALDIPDDLDFLGTLSGMSVFMVQFGGKTQLCDAMDQPDPMKAFGVEMSAMLKEWGTRLYNWSYAGATDPNSSLYDGSLGQRQWMYQACTEIGGGAGVVNTANPDTTRSMSSSLTNSLPDQYCDQFFGIELPPNLDAMNAKYYYPMLDPSTSNILFVSGDKDPACFPFSISKENGNATNPNTVSYTVDGGSHCQDIEPPTDHDSASLRGARDLEVKLAIQWSQLAPNTH